VIAPVLTVHVVKSDENNPAFPDNRILGYTDDYMNEAWVKCRLFGDMHGLMIILILV